MGKNKSKFSTAKFWEEPIGKLNTAADALARNANVITSALRNDLITGRFVGLPDSISILENKFQACANDIALIAPRVDKLLAIQESPLSAEIAPIFSVNHLAKESYIRSTDSILASTASMADTLQSDTERLFHIDNRNVSIFSTDSPTIFPTSDQLITMNGDIHNSLLSLGDRIQTNVTTFNNLAETSIATIKMNAHILAQPEINTDIFLQNTANSFIELNHLATNVYDEFALLPSIETNNFLFTAPTIEPYATARASSVLAGVDDRTFQTGRVRNSDELLDDLGDELESRLNVVSSELSSAYNEGLSAIQSGHHGWIRHAGVSFRTMFQHLLEALAPNEELYSYFDNPQTHMLNGEFKRNARLQYIFRGIAIGSYAEMAEQDIKLAEATFFPSNEIVHKLSSPLTEQQMRVFCRRIQGSVSVVLAAAGY